MLNILNPEQYEPIGCAMREGRSSGWYGHEQPHISGD